jgi:hypothetical protein
MGGEGCGRKRILYALTYIRDIGICLEGLRRTGEVSGNKPGDRCLNREHPVYEVVLIVLYVPPCSAGQRRMMSFKTGRTAEHALRHSGSRAQTCRSTAGVSLMSTVVLPCQ